MAYICRNCGKIISDNDYHRDKVNRENAIGCGCFLWIIIILCFCSIVLVPIAIILLGISNSKNPKSICPSCNSENTLIPINTPVGKKMLEENYSSDEIEKLKTSVTTGKQNANKIREWHLLKNEKVKKICLWILVLVIAAWLVVGIVVFLNV